MLARRLLVLALLTPLATACSSAGGTSEASTDAGRKAVKDAGTPSSSDDDVTADDDATSDGGDLTDSATDATENDDGAADAAPDGASDAGQPSEAGAVDEGGGGTGACGGSTPHGCLAPVAGNPAGCPPQIPEQSAYYPPTSEWKGCGTVQPYADCKYSSGSLNGDCVCDTGLHWLCTYP